MSNHNSSGRTDSADELQSDPDLPDAIQTTERYQIDEATVFYDSENPLGWLQTDSAVRLDERA